MFDEVHDQRAEGVASDGAFEQEILVNFCLH